MVDFNDRYVWSPGESLEANFIDVATITPETKIPDGVRRQANRSALTGMRTWFFETHTPFNNYPGINQKMLIENDDFAYHFIIIPFLHSPRMMQAQMDVEMACRDNLVESRLVPAFVSVCHMMTRDKISAASFIKNPTPAEIVTTEIAYNRFLNPFVPWIAYKVSLAAKKAIEEGQLNG